MTVAVALLAVVGVALPHLMRLDRARPATAAALWMAALTIRALASISFALYALLVFPDTSLYRAITHWCQHAVAPLLGVHVDMQGHAIGAVLVLIPIVAATGALLLAAIRTGRAVYSVRRLVDSGSLGVGPQGSVIVGGPDVVVAAAGMVRPRVVVTAGTLAMLDDEELAAGLAHEHGHIARRHHLLLAYAEGCRAVAGRLPGTGRAISELRFQLERDADEWALRHHHDPCALASAICKAATLRPAPIVVGLGGGTLERRVDELMGIGSVTPGSRRRRFIDTAAVLMVCVALGSTVALPTEALAGGAAQVVPHAEHHCES
jgi:Zn-dependent protease with chaperone function